MKHEPFVINFSCIQDSRRDAASDSASMNDERPTTNDIADGDEFRPAVYDLRYLFYLARMI